MHCILTGDSIIFMNTNDECELFYRRQPIEFGIDLGPLECLKNLKMIVLHCNILDFVLHIF